MHVDPGLPAHAWRVVGQAYGGASRGCPMPACDTSLMPVASANRLKSSLPSCSVVTMAKMSAHLSSGMPSHAFFVDGEVARGPSGREEVAPVHWPHDG